MKGEKERESEGKRRKMFRLHRHKPDKSGHRFHFNFSGFQALQVSLFSLYILCLLPWKSESHISSFQILSLFLFFFLLRRLPRNQTDLWSFFFFFSFFFRFFPVSAVEDGVMPSNLLFYWKVELDFFFFLVFRLLLSGKFG